MSATKLLVLRATVCGRESVGEGRLNFKGISLVNGKCLRWGQGIGSVMET